MVTLYMRRDPKRRRADQSNDVARLSAFQASYVLSVVTTMTLFSDLHRITAVHGPFHGTSDTDMIVMLQQLRQHNRMRFTADGRPESATLSRLFKQSFKDNFHLSSAQYDCIVDVFDRSPIEDIPTAIGASFPRPVEGVRPQYLSRTFASGRTRCCGRALVVRHKWATVYLKDDCYPAWNIVKTCRFGCGARYMFDKRVLPGVYDGGQCDWHVHNPWTDVELPLFIGSKSGHAIFCTKFLDHVAVEQATTR